MIVKPKIPLFSASIDFGKNILPLTISEYTEYLYWQRIEIVLIQDL